MSKIRSSILKITSLEELTHKDTVIHQLPPMVKLLSTLIYLVMVISFRPDQVSSLIPFIFYPILLMAFGEIPFKPLFGRLIIALPFTLFAGLSTMIFSKEIAFYLGNVAVTVGMVSFISIIMKTILTVMAVLILISTTSIKDLLYVMVALRVPSILILQVTMTFRYLGVLLEEISVMHHAYILRAPREKGIKLADMGPFLGQLIIRSFDRAERIYNAMKCRGFEGGIRLPENKSIPASGWIYLILVSGLLIVMRIVNISEIIGRLFI